jgi:hypothetical protein
MFVVEGPEDFVAGDAERLGDRNGVVSLRKASAALDVGERPGRDADPLADLIERESRSMPRIPDQLSEIVRHDSPFHPRTIP